MQFSSQQLEYLRHHKLDGFFTTIAQKIVNERPTEPYEVIQDVFEKYRHNRVDVSEVDPVMEASTVVAQQPEPPLRGVDSPGVAFVMTSLGTLQEDVGKCLTKMSLTSFDRKDIDEALRVASEASSSLVRAVHTLFLDLEKTYKTANSTADPQSPQGSSPDKKDAVEKAYIKDLGSLALTLERMLDVVDRVNPKTFGIGVTSDRFRVDAESLMKDPGQPDYFSHCPSGGLSLEEALAKIDFSKYSVCGTTGRGVAEWNRDNHCQKNLNGRATVWEPMTPQWIMKVAQEATDPTTNKSIPPELYPIYIYCLESAACYEGSPRSNSERAITDSLGLWIACILMAEASF